jgi:hypothetical protein
METEPSFLETSVSYDATTRRQRPEDLDLNLHRRENIKSHASSQTLGFEAGISVYRSSIMVRDFDHGNRKVKVKVTGRVEV